MFGATAWATPDIQNLANVYRTVAAAGKGRIMRLRIALTIGLYALLCMGAPIGNAQPRNLPPDLLTLIEGFQAHRRTALGYLRTQNVELGAAEIERLRERWARDRAALSVTDAALAAALVRAEADAAASHAAADAGDLERARELLERAASPLDAWRWENGIRLFSDCIAEVSEAYERLDPFRRNPPDLADAGTAAAIVAAAMETVAALRRCEGEAASAVRGDAVFRRLVDGMLDSLRQMPEAVGARDGARLYRLLIEQRSFERLLAFRFG
jgi:hypothetical protein